MHYQSLLDSLHEDFPLLASNLHPRLDDETGIELVLRDRLSGSFGDVLRSLEQLGEARVSSLTSVFLYKDFVAGLTETEQVQFYETLGRALGGQLEEFSLSFIRLPAASLASLLRRMPRLQKLYLGRVCLLQKQQAHELYSVLQSGGLKHLSDFHCSLASALSSQGALFQTETDTLDEFLQSVAQLPFLRNFYLSAPLGRGSIQSTDCLRALSVSSIRDLTLMNCPLPTSQHVQALMHCGKNSFSSLSLMNAGIGDVGATIIVQKSLGGLKKLFLPGNNLTDLAGYAIAKVLRTTHNTSLRVLDLHDNRLTAKFGHCMGKTLEHPNCQLHFLDVSYNPLLDAGGMALARALVLNTTLQQLNLFQNQISDKTCAALATALQSNRTLKQLNLYHNPKIKTVDSILHNLEHNNYVLERLEVQSANQQDALNFWLTLNRKFERKNLLSGNASDGQYLDKGLGQASQANDLNSLFYFLKSKPSFCHAPTQRRASKRLSQVTTEACQLLVEDLE